MDRNVEGGCVTIKAKLCFEVYIGFQIKPQHNGSFLPALYVYWFSELFKLKKKRKRGKKFSNPLT